MRIAIFSDIHGKILLPFKMVSEYQRRYNEKIDLIIQCGDIGAYPNLENLDKATMRHAKRDKDELGFHYDFTKYNKDIDVFLKHLDVQMICVRGNHEDHDFLDDLEHKFTDDERFPIDVYNYVWLCKSGEVQYFNTENEKLSFVGLGRIGDRKDRQEKRFIQKYEFEKIEKLFNSLNLYDLLITHDADNTEEIGYGSKEIREVLNHMPFQYHFYGHTGKDFSSKIDQNGITQSIKIKELEFDLQGKLPENCMLILEKEEEFNLKKIPTSFINLFTKENWRNK